MVKACSAWGCSNRFQKRTLESANRQNDVTFHAFPKDEVLAKRWAAALRRENFIQTRTKYICSSHFLPSDYHNSGFRRKLKRHVVPSVFFSFPPHLQKVPTRQRRLIKRQTLKPTPKPIPMPVNPCNEDVKMITMSYINMSL